MSFWGNLLKIVAVGAFFVATGAIGGLAAGTLRTAIGLGGMAANYLANLIDRPNLLQDRQRIMLDTTLEPGTPLPVVYGRARVGAIAADLLR